MTVTTPPRKRDIERDSELERRVAELEAQAEQALIEEARRMARRRRRRNGVAVLLVACAGVAAFIGFGGTGGGGAGGVALADGSGVEGLAAAAASSLSALPAGAAPQAFAFDPRRPNIVYVTSANGGVHVFKTTDGGRHWQPTGARGAGWAGDILSLTADSEHPGTLYAGSDTAVYKTVNGGRSWRPFNEGLFPLPGARVCYRLAPYVKPTCVKQPWHFGTAGTTNWNRGNGWVGDIAVDPADSSVVYAAAGEVRKSTDGGRSWKAMHLPYAKNWHEVARIAIAPTRPASIYAIAHTNMVSNSTAIYKSTDAGSHWHATGGPNPGLPTSGSHGSTDELVVDPRHPQTIYAAIGGMVLKTTDGGDHWQSITDGLPPRDASSPPFGLPAGNVTSLAADPQRPGTLYVGLHTGLYEGSIYTTTDAGHSWTLVLKGAVIAALAVNPARPTTIWAAAWGGKTEQNGTQTWQPRIYRSTNRGRTWASAP